MDLRRLGRLGGAGLLAGAFGLFAFVAVPHWSAGGDVAAILALVTAVGGVAALLAPWSSESTTAGMVVTAGSYAALGVAGLTGGSQAALGPLFVAVSAWCGLALGPKYALKLSPLALLCAILPASLGHPGTIPTGFGAIIVATLTGEIFARLADRVRHDARRDAGRTRALERLTAGQVELARARYPREAATIAAAVARDILGAGSTSVLLERDGKHVVLGQCPHPHPQRRQPTGTGGRDHPQDPTENRFEVPLVGRTGTGVRGLLTAEPRPGERLDPFGQALAASLAAATCAALETIALNARLRTRAEVDPLTGLGNRRRLDTALARLRPGDVVIVLDLDNFKAVNDTLGHDIGDQVLRSFGAHLSTQTRAGELAVRTGGEEFVLIVDGGGQAQGVAALLGRLAAGWWRQSPLTTFSAGAAVHHGGDPAVTMKLADQALYEAKHRGRAAGWLVTGHLEGNPQPSAAVHGSLAGRLIPFPGRPFRRREPVSDVVLSHPEFAGTAAPVR